jgi:aminoglycoside phosphotransferase (APT) family kinase protein
VPRVIYYCDNPDVLGTPFYLVERVPGSPFGDYAVSDWMVNASEAFRSDVSRQYVHAFASLARLRPLDILGPPVTPVTECLRWQRFAKIARNHRLAGLLDRLMKTPPPPSGPPAPAHGDPKMSNMLWLNGALQSLLDWEIAANGEPLLDLGYMLTFFASDLHPAGIGFDLAGMWGRERVISEWERVSGRPAHDIEWYEAAAAAKISSITAYGYHLAATKQVSDPRMLEWLPYTNYWTDTIERLLDTATAPR